MRVKTVREILDVLDQIKTYAYSPWEQSYVNSVRHKINNYLPLTDKQKNILHKIYIKAKGIKWGYRSGK